MISPPAGQLLGHVDPEEANLLRFECMSALELKVCITCWGSYLFSSSIFHVPPGSTKYRLLQILLSALYNLSCLGVLSFFGLITLKNELFQWMTY